MFDVLLQKLIEQEPLNQQHIECLSPFSSEYIAPINTKHVRPYCLIFYNEHDREGAREEANTLNEGFACKGFDVQMQNWEHTNHLLHRISASIDAVSDSCSIMVISILAHGQHGMVRGVEKSEITFNDVVEKIKQKLPVHIPLVSS